MKQAANEQARRNEMLTRPIPRVVAKLALPAVVTQLITLIYNTADTYFVSQINKSASAGVGATFAVMSLIHAIGFGYAMGASSLCSRHLGANEKEEAERYANSALIGSILSGLLLCLLGFSFLRPILTLVGCSETMLPYALPYARWILIAAPLLCGTFVLNNVLRAEGQATYSMIGTVSGGFLNMALDPLFIFKFGMGTAGAALATAVGMGLSFLVLLVRYLSGRTIVKLSLKKISRKPKTYWQILSTGFPTICRQGWASLATAALNTMAVGYGDAAVAAMTIANKCYMLARNIVLGVGQGFQPVAGYNFGAKRYDRTKKAFWFASGVGSAICILLCGIFAIFSKQIMTLFIADEEVIAFGSAALRFSSMVLPVLAFSTYVNQLCQCLGFRWQATLLASLRQGIFFLPIVLLLPRLVGEVGVQAAQPLSDLLTFLVSVPFLIVFLKKRLKDPAQTKKSP